MVTGESPYLVFQFFSCVDDNTEDITYVLGVSLQVPLPECSSSCYWSLQSIVSVAMLDHNFTPKLSDFGLAKCAPRIKA